MIGKRCECDDISNFSQSLSDRPVAPFFQGDPGALYLERKNCKPEWKSSQIYIDENRCPRRWTKEHKVKEKQEQ